MNIWAWVEAAQAELRRNGRERLADLIDLVPHYMSDNMHEQLDSVMPEALALAREAKHPWIEVFLRHWNLQSRILQRYEVREFLSEAVNLIDFANKEDTKDCPQSVCTTQDLANCYAHLDGPAYAEERLEVARETLARITPEWPCFTCISGEYATALLDAGDPDKALSFIEKQKSELVRIGRADRKDEMVGTNIDALIALGRLEEALEMNRKARDLGRGESFMDFRRLDEARILARLGRPEEAKKHLLPFEEVMRTPSQYEPWAEAVFHLAEARAIDNDALLHGELERLIQAMKANGVSRRAIQLALWQGRLALLRERPFSARRSAATIARLIPELRAPLRAPELLARFEREIAELEARLGPPPPLPDRPEAVLEALGTDPEIDVWLASRALERWPDHQDLVLALSQAATHLQDHEEAIAVLRRHLGLNPDAPAVLLGLLNALRKANHRRELDQLIESTLARTRDPEVRMSCRWVLALEADDRGDKERAKSELEAILEEKEGAVNARLLLARIERELGDHARALVHLERLVAQQPPGPWDWELVLSATLEGRWDLVRSSSKRLGMEIEGEGPVDIDGELIRVEFPPDAEGEDGATYHAIRTGPVTARVVEIAHPAHLQRFGDRVVFDARPKNDGPKPGEESHHTYIYPVVARTQAGNYQSAIIDGAHPGEERLRALKQAAAEIGCRIEQRSDASYTIEDADTGERVPGLYAFLAFPKAVAAKDVHALLLEKTRDLVRPLVWLDLARMAGDEQRALEQAEIAERYQLY